MKRFFVFSFIVFFNLNLQAQTNTWIGGAAGNWSNNASWSLNHFPTTVEDAIINTNSNINVDVFVSLVNNINSLHITGGVSVTLSCFAGGGGGTRTLQLFSTSLITPGLKIDAGNTLTMDATNATGTGNWNLALTGGIGVTGIIDGTLQFAGTGAGTGGARLDVFAGPTSNASLTVSGTGKILYLVNTGNTASAAGSYLTLQSGAVYEIQKNGGSFPNANWNSNSLAKATSAVASTAPPQFLGTTYGNLEWNLPNQGTAAAINILNISFNNVDLISTGSTSVRAKGGTGATAFNIIINGNLTVSPGAILETSGNTTTSGAPGIIEVKGNIINNGIIRENSTVTGNQFQLTGTSNQNISGNGSWIGDDLTFVLNNTNGATLLSALILPYNLQLTNGKIKTTATNILTMIDNANYTIGSLTSFVEGPMKKIGDEPFDFPIGVGSILAPIGISGGAGAAVTDEFIAEYKRSDPRIVHNGTSKDPFFDHISYVEYWTLIRNTGVATKDVRMFVHRYSFAKKFNTTYASLWNGTLWANLGRTPDIAGPNFPPYETGIITTSTTGLFGDFTLATPDIFSANPLPIKLISFDVKKINAASALLNWELAACCSDAARFEVEKSTDNRNFISFDKVSGSLTDRFYTIQDTRLKKGVTYYRLKMTDDDGTITYSRTLSIINNEEGFLITSLWPNPVQNNATIILSAAKADRIRFAICDLSGKTVKQWYVNNTEGNNYIPVNSEGLAPGIYHLIAATENNKVVLRFIKQ